MEGTGVGVGDGVGSRVGVWVGSGVGDGAGVGIGVGEGVGAGVGWGSTLMGGGGGSVGETETGWGSAVGARRVGAMLSGVGAFSGVGGASLDLEGKHATSRSAAANSGKMTPTARPDQRLRPIANLSILPIVSYSYAARLPVGFNRLQLPSAPPY